MSLVRTFSVTSGLVSVAALVAISLPALPGASAAAPLVDPTCAGVPATIAGTDGDDVLDGTPGDDVIVGGPGADRIDGSGGDDVICGDEGIDQITGGQGDDDIRAGLDGTFEGSSSGGSTYDILNGDTVTASPGRDRIDLGEDPRWADDGLSTESFDQLSFAESPVGIRARLAAPGEWGQAYGDGVDRIRGQRHLTVIGSTHADLIVGSAGPDEIGGNGGADVLRGGGGDDRIWTNFGLADRARVLLVGGGGDDSLSGRGPSTLVGGRGDDSLSGRFASGGAGRDQLSATLTRNGVCESVSGGSGEDLVNLGSPTDTEANPSHTVDVRLDLRSGTASFGPKVCHTFRDAVEAITLGGDYTQWRVIGSAKSEELRYRAWGFGGSTVHARMRGGNDVMFGSFGDDVLDGGAGRDRADGMLGQDKCPEVELRTSCHPR